LWQFFRVVAHNADQKSALSLSHVCFSLLLATTPIIFPHCGPKRKIIIGVVTYNVEKCSASWQQHGKMFEFDYLHKFETIREFTLGFQSGVYADYGFISAIVEYDMPAKN
jgi:hypothetical protein